MSGSDIRRVELSKEDVLLLIEALDSHCYWQLSDEQYRHDGFVCDPGSDEPETRTELIAAETLSERLEALVREQA